MANYLTETQKEKEKFLILLQVIKVSEVNLATTNDVDTAVDAAKKAFVTWSQKTPLFRARILFKFKELIEKNSDELTKLNSF